jgi:hypothetical protein
MERVPMHLFPGGMGGTGNSELCSMWGIRLSLLYLLLLVQTLSQDVWVGPKAPKQEANPYSICSQHCLAHVMI